MKTTVLTTVLLALCPVSQAVDLSQSASLQEIVTWNDFSSLTAVGADDTSYTISTTGSYTQSDTLVLSGGRATLDLSAAGLDLASGFTLHLNVSNLNVNNGPFVYFTSDETYSTGGSNLAVGHNGAQNWIALCNGSVNGVNNNLSAWTAGSSLFSGDLWVSIIQEGDTTARISMYLADGTCLVDATTNRTLASSNDAYKYLVLGGWVNATSTGTHTMTLNSMGVYSGIVPEPATATLGLLGLAALGCRRRRK